MPPIVLPRTGAKKPSAGQNPYFADIDFTLQRFDDAWDAVYVPCVADGATNNTALIVAAIAAATPGDVLRFPRGPILTDPFAVNKCLHLRGAGKFSTRFIATSSAAATPMVNFTVSVDSGMGVYDNYGASFEGIGIDTTARVNAVGLNISGSADWFRGRDIFVQGGYRSIAILRPQAVLEDLVLFDATDCYLYVVQEGLELDIRQVKMARNTAGTTDAYIKVDLTGGGGSYGALYMDNLQGNRAPLGTINRPIDIIAVSPTTFNCFMRQVILDNCSGAGRLTRVSGLNFVDGWINAAAGAGTACWLIDGCNNLKFSGNRYFGGFGGSTYEFTGAVSDGFESVDNICPTGPAYKVGANNKPTNINVDDYLVGATDIGQVTNDPAWFENASRRTWGARRFQSMLRRRETGTAPPSGFGYLAGGLLTVNHPSVVTNSRVRLSRATTGATGVPGTLHCNVANNVVGTSFLIQSTSATDTSGVYWEFLGDAD